MRKLIVFLLLSLPFAAMAQVDLKSRWIVNLNGFRFTLHNAGDSIFRVRTDSILFGKPTNLGFASQSALNDSAAAIRTAIGSGGGGTADSLTVNPHQFRISGDTLYTKAKVYACLWSYDGAAGDPSVIVLENTVGSIVWTRTGDASFRGTLAGAFTADKVIINGVSLKSDLSDKGGVIPIYGDGKLVANVHFSMGDENYISINLLDGTASDVDDQAIYKLGLEIKIYP